MSEKSCIHCEEEKPLSEFPRHHDGRDGTENRCKACKLTHERGYRKSREFNTPERRERRTAYSKRWKKRNKEKVAAEAKKWYEIHKSAIRAKSIRAYIEDKYGGTPCMDCDGVFDWCAMDFDHRPEETKLFQIASFGSRKFTPENLATVEKEIAKCDIICSNCHRVRTFITRKK